LLWVNLLKREPTKREISLILLPPGKPGKLAAVNLLIPFAE